MDRLAFTAMASVNERPFQRLAGSRASVFAELEYIVQDGLDHPRGEGQQWPLPDDFNAADSIEPTSAELCWADGLAGQELKVRSAPPAQGYLQSKNALSL